MPVDAAIAAVAARQHGVISFAQLPGLGVGRGAIRWRLSHGRLHRVHKGVYAVGHPSLTRDGRLMAAALSVGDDSALSHRSAGALWGLRSWSGQIELTTPRRLPDRDGLRIFERPLPQDEVRHVRGIPVTSPSRTLLDLAGVLDQRGLERAVEQAHVLRLEDGLPLVALFERYPHRKGIAQLKAITVEERVTRAELERRFLDLIRDAKLPEPRTNLVVEGHEVDCVWRGPRLIVELDGRSTHLNPVAFERDRERDRILVAAGWRVIRATWQQVHERRKLVTDLHAVWPCILSRKLSLASAPIPPPAEDDHVRGEGVLVIEYADFECPYCAKTAALLEGVAVKRVFRHFPVVSKHPRSRRLAHAAEAAALQGRFWEFHDSLYADQGRLDDPHLWQRVEELGLDVARFDADRRSDAVAARVERDFRAGIRAGITTTPTLFVDGQAHAGIPGAALLQRLGSANGS